MDVRLHDRFIANVNAILEERDMTRTDLAALMAVNLPYIQQYIGTAKGGAARSQPGLEVVSKFATALELDPVELLKEPAHQLAGVA